MTQEAIRKRFNTTTAPMLARQLGVADPARGGSRRFAYFADDHRFVVVAGEQEGHEVELAFAYGLTYREHRRLVLVLPARHAGATLQRVPWFKLAAQPELWLHDGSATFLQNLPSQSQTIENVRKRLKGQSPADELRAAGTALHLGDLSPSVATLVEWATAHPVLDPGHRPDERAWHCMGQKVLSITKQAGTLVTKAGIHYTGPDRAPEPRTIAEGATLDEGHLRTIKEEVEDGIEERLSGSPPIHRPDEHWLQAVIRRDPSLVGVEQPALRELPAWRPRDDPSEWARGFIDLIGIDGHGDIRVVETKLADNKDALLVLQGLDYYVWANAYREVLAARLGAARQAQLEIHYVVGDTADGKIHLSRFTRAQAINLDDTIRWRFQTMHHWFGEPHPPRRAASELLPADTLPG